MVKEKINNDEKRIELLCWKKKRDVIMIIYRYKGLIMEVEKYKNNMMLVLCVC